MKNYDIIASVDGTEELDSFIKKALPRLAQPVFSRQESSQSVFFTFNGRDYCLRVSGIESGFKDHNSIIFSVAKLKGSSSSNSKIGDVFRAIKNSVHEMFDGMDNRGESSKYTIEPWSENGHTEYFKHSQGAYFSGTTELSGSVAGDRDGKAIFGTSVAYHIDFVEEDRQKIMTQVASLVDANHFSQEGTSVWQQKVSNRQGWKRG